MKTRRSGRSNPAYRLHKRSGQAVVTLDGRDHYLGSYSSDLSDPSRRQYDRLIAAWLDGGRRMPGSAATPRMTVADLLDRFWSYAQTYYAGGELGHYRWLVHRLREQSGAMFMDDFGPLALKRFREGLVADGRCRIYTNKLIGRVRLIWRWGVENELIPPDLDARLRAVRGLRRGKTTAPERPPVRPVAHEFVEEVLKHVPAPVAAATRVMMQCGARPSELLSMRPFDLDTTGPIWLFTVTEHKNDWREGAPARIIPLNKTAQRILAPLLKRDLQFYVFSPLDSLAERASAAGGHRRPGQKPTPRRTARIVRPRYDAASFRRALARGCELAFPPPEGLTGPELRRWRDEHRFFPYQVRHTVATEARRIGGVEAAQSLLGHRTPDVTQRYAEAHLGRAVEVVQRLG